MKKEQIRQELITYGMSSDFEKFVKDRFGVDIAEVVVKSLARQEKVAMVDFSDLDYGLTPGQALKVARIWDFQFRCSTDVVAGRLGNGSPWDGVKDGATMRVDNAVVKFDQRKTKTLVKVSSDEDLTAEDWSGIAIALVKKIAKK